MSDDICDICMTFTKSKIITCDLCKKSICVRCFNNISYHLFDDDYEITILFYNCPMCRHSNQLSYYDFQNDELAMIANNIMRQIKKLKAN